MDQSLWCTVRYGRCLWCTVRYSRCLRCTVRYGRCLRCTVRYSRYLWCTARYGRCLWCTAHYSSVCGAQCTTPVSTVYYLRTLALVRLCLVLFFLYFQVHVSLISSTSRTLLLLLFLCQILLPASFL